MRSGRYGAFAFLAASYQRQKSASFTLGTTRSPNAGSITLRSSASFSRVVCFSRRVNGLSGSVW